MQQFSIIDPFNLRDFIKTVVDFVRQNDESSMRTTLDLLELLFFEIGERTDGKKAKPVYDFQKALSGNIAPDKLEYIFDDIDQIYQNCKSIAVQIEEIPQYHSFLTGLVSSASRKFFEDWELEKLTSALDSHSETVTQDLIFQFLCHGFRNLDRIPAQLSQSLYAEAQTYDYNQPLRFSLLKTAADCGSKEAALEYGNYVNRTRSRALSADEIEEAFTYTMMAVPMNAALWNLSYLLDQDCLSRQQIELLDANLKIDAKIEKLKDSERKELGYVTCSLSNKHKKRAFVLAYKINFYLSCKGFTKAYNSLAKYLSLQIYGFQLNNNDQFEKIDDLIEYYYRKAIAGGNILAMHNMASKIQKRHPKQSTEEFLFAENLLQTSVSMGMNSSYEALGLLYLDAGKTAQAKDCLQYALDHSGRKGLILYKLGIIEPKLDEKVKFFLNAIREGYIDAAIDYALCEHNLFQLDGKSIHLRNAINILQQFALATNVEKRDVFLDIQNNLEEILEKIETAG